MGMWVWKGRTGSAKLENDLDFDTDGDGAMHADGTGDATDAYYNDGAGCTPGRYTSGRCWAGWRRPGWWWPGRCWRGRRRTRSAPMRRRNRHTGSLTAFRDGNVYFSEQDSSRCSGAGDPPYDRLEYRYAPTESWTVYEARAPGVPFNCAELFTSVRDVDINPGDTVPAMANRPSGSGRGGRNAPRRAWR